MKDFLGSELAAGDWVILIAPGYRELKLAQVVRFTKCYVVVSWKSKYTSRCTELRQLPEQLVRMQPEQVSWHLLNHQDTP